MPARKNPYHCSPIFYGLLAVLFLFLSLTGVRGGFGAESPFEIEIGDLDRGETSLKETKKPQSRPSAEKRDARTVTVPNEHAKGRPEGDFVRYTIRSGDNIFTILTRHFGMTAKKAERLIPEIKRINGIVDTSGLQIGQVLLLPISRKKVVVPKATPASDPVPETIPAPPVALENPAPEILPVPPPTIDAGILQRANEFWARLFPERKTMELTPGGDGAVANDPFLVGVNGKKVHIVPLGVPPVFGNLSGAGAAKGERVVADPANEKGFVKDLLQAAGFATSDGGTPLEFGTEPTLYLKADFIAAKRLPGAEIRNTILVSVEKNGCQTLPESFVSYLAAKNFRLVAWCDLTEKPLVSSGVQILSVPRGKPELLADAVLEALSLKASKDYPVEIMVGQSGTSPLSVTVDRYFEREGRHFFLDFGNAAPNRATLFRLLELAGYQRITFGGTDTFRTISAKISEAVKVPLEYRKYLFSSIPDGRLEVEIAGILFQRPGTSGEKTFLTDILPEQPFLDLLKAIPWGTQ